MSGDRAFERALQAWLTDDGEAAPHQLVRHVIASARATPQERDLGRLWRGGALSHRLAMAAALTAVVSLTGIGILLNTSPDKPPLAGLAPTGFQASGTIAFTRFDPATGEPGLYLIDPSSADETRIAPGYGCCGVFAPDGRSIAIGFQEVSDFRGPGQLETARVVRIDGHEMYGIPWLAGGGFSQQGIEWLPRAWSPDGRAIAVEVKGIDDPARNGVHVAPASTDSGWQTYVTGQGNRDVPVAFSPDGTELLFLRVTEERFSQVRGELHVVTIADGSIRRVSPAEVSVATGGPFVGTAWSPDGSMIAFVGYESLDASAAGQLYVAAADGGDLQVFMDGVTSVAWSPDGESIAVSVTSSGADDLLVLRPDGSDVWNLTADVEASVVGPRWSPDGRNLLALGSVPGANGDGYLIVVPVDGGSIAQVTTVLGPYAEWSWGLLSRDDL